MVSSHILLKADVVGGLIQALYTLYTLYIKRYIISTSSHIIKHYESYIVRTLSGGVTGDGGGAYNALNNKEYAELFCSVCMQNLLIVRQCLVRRAGYNTPRTPGRAGCAQRRRPGWRT